MSDAQVAMFLPMNLNPMPHLWHKLLEFMKVAQIAYVQVLGNVEDEITFNPFLESKLRYQLTSHLDLVVHMCSQDFYTSFTKLQFHIGKLKGFTMEGKSK